MTTRSTASEHDAALAAVAPLERRPGYLLRRAEQRADQILAEQGGNFTRTQYGALSVLSRVDGLDQRRLGELLHIDRTTTSVVVKLLERRGHVRRDTAPKDRRRRILSLTEAGRAALPAIESAANNAQERLLACLADDERAELARLLKKIIDG